MGRSNQESNLHEEFERTVNERYAGLKVTPSNNETLAAGPKDCSTYTKELTPIDEFYIFNHYPTPESTRASGRCR